MRPRGEEGFSLVEIMVVLVIIGLAAGVAALGFGDGTGEVRREAERLGARMLAARDHALFAQAETAAVIEAGGYRFEERRGGEWQPLTTRAIRPHSWDEVRPRGTLPMRVRFDAVGLAEPARLLLVHGDAEAELNVGADGEVSIAP